MKFTGTLEELKAIMMRIASPCKWSGTRNHFQCRVPSGAILNWWASTGTISVQGPDRAAADLEAVLERFAWHPANESIQGSRDPQKEDIEVEYWDVTAKVENRAPATVTSKSRLIKRT